MVQRMRILLFCLLTVCILSGVAAAQELGARKSFMQGKYSMRPPEGWKLEVDKDGEGFSADAPGKSAHGTNLVVGVGDGKLKDFCDALVAEMKKRNATFTLLDQEPCSLRAGLKGQKLFAQLINQSKVRVRLTIYIIGMPNDAIVYVVCGTKAEEEKKYAATFEDSVGTLRAEP